MGPALLRPFLAVVLLAGFLARATGLELAHRCPDSAAAAHGGGHGDHGHRQHPGTPDRCECVGQSCTTTVAVPVARTALAAPAVRLASHRLPPTASPDRPASPHLLPFAQAPPA